MTVDEIKTLKVAKVKCDKSLLFFTRYFFKKLKNQKFILNWHHDVICKALEDVANYLTIFLNINISPRTSKTELVVNFIAQNLGKNPKGNYLYITASDDLRSETSVKIRDIITSPEYKAMYGIELKKDQNAKNLWRTEQGGGLKTATIFGQITGFGAGQMIEHNKDLEEYLRDFEGCIILDDINKIADAEALTANNTKTNNTIFNTIFSRKNSKDTPIINIQQRAGIEDATSALLDYYKNEEKVCNLVIPIIKDGVPMWEWKFPLEEIEKLRTHPDTSHMFETQYMQNPLPKEGLIFPNLQLYNYEDFAEVDGITIGYADTADKGTDDFSEPIGKIVNNKFYLRDVIFNKFSLDTNTPLCLAKIEEHKMDYLYIETNREGMGVVRDLRDKTPCTVRAFNNFENKIVRIFAQAGFIMNYFVFPRSIPNNPDYDRFLKQIQRMTHTTKKDDDAPDSVAGLANQIRRNHFIKID
jgi:predicted phage terminase large subunit-like protein